MLDELSQTKNGAEDSIHVPEVLPVMALKDVVLYPFTIVPLSVGRDASVRAVDQALAGDRLILCVTQRDPTIDTPAAPDDLFEVGCVAMVMRMLKLPDGTTRVLVQGLSRARVEYFTSLTPSLEARLHSLPEPELETDPLRIEAFLRAIKEGLERITALGRQISPEVMLIAANLEDPMRLADLAASNLSLKVADAQRVLETTGTKERLELVNDLLSREIALLEVQHDISAQARGDLDRSQREFFLRQQLKTIQRELGEIDDTESAIADYRTKAEEVGLSDEARQELDKQIRRLASMHPDSAETAVVRTWLDWITGLPWSKTSDDCLDIKAARSILDEDHYGLRKIKERVLEFLAVRSLRPEGRGPILCFVGPPGVGKTSLGRSIARALGRSFVRISLGGIRDEAEIRGHRRTYVGALPGRIIQGINQGGTANPVFMLDEVDKIGTDSRGDPSSALLEVLDPEQNHTFRDHYLGVAFDLSKVLFIATGNVTETIQPAFLDRMEVIRLNGYSEEEKIEIARRHLLPRQIEQNGLAEQPPTFSTSALKVLIEGYTMEAGLRNLEREISAVCRKVAVRIAERRRPPRRITPGTVERLLGPRTVLREGRLTSSSVGVVTGLAYTAAGGEVLLIEALALPGKPRLELTGSLGDVMKESASAALSFARAHAADLGITDGWFDCHGLHLHVPAGAIPKDGPSAGVAMLTAIASAASGKPVRHDLAMTGEMTLRGEVLAVGGVREKVLAALRSGIRDLVLPSDNQRDLAELPVSARRNARIRTVTKASEVLEAALIQPQDTDQPTG